VATLAEVKDACGLAGVWGDIEALPEGLETRIGDQIIHRLPQGFRQRLALARAFVKRAPVLLLDEAANGLDDAGDQSFVECLRKLKGAATIIMVTHRPSHIRLADRVIHLEGGAAAMIGAPDDYLTKLFGGNNGGAGRKSA
jgi:ABC-type bacteriocin/lantibiotic exporter with double-glycine peptidase domain